MSTNPMESPIFRERVAFLNESQFWSREQLLALQMKKLRELVQHAEKHVPFYREIMGRKGFSWQDIRSLADIVRFPMIDKRTIQADYNAFIADTAEAADLIHRTTGGSTGTPLTVYSDDAFTSRDKANTEHYMGVFDLNIFDHRSVRLYGDKINADLLDQGVYWYEVDGRKLIMSCYHIDAKTAPAYVSKINEHGPAYIHTRPSSILPLANQILGSGLKVTDTIRIIVCDGEYVTDGQRNIIERAFGARLVNIYGHTEGCTFGHPCKHSPSLHFTPQVGILELLGEDGREVTEPGVKGELVVTGFNNHAFPLIRYRTGDIGILGDQACPCGRNYKILNEIEGRFQDYVVDAKGNLVPLAPAVFNYNDMDWKGIHEFQVLQERVGELRFQIQLEPQASAEPEDAKVWIAERLAAIFGGAFKISVECVADIPKTRIGKHRYLDQRLNVSTKAHAF